MNKTKPPLPVKPAIKFLSPALETKISRWNKIKEEIAFSVELEQKLRRELASLLVPNPAEGSNRIDNAECEVQLVHKVTRKLDESALDRVMPQLPEEYRKVGTPGDLIYFKANFDLEVYRKMSAEHKKIFEQALEIKDAMPTLEIELKLPAQPAGKVELIETPSKKKPARLFKPSPLVKQMRLGKKKTIKRK